ncbi:hypothetical protein [Nocardia sp. alder85J]|uniref:hypothetical protein n=1 Tax=Nocardia sp. alder85J TaxID=2862949 RepID=UPI001CD7689C|nr:hypothetical protein [Nocardia sp. alder85J]MCX4096106.1 hypothetical protein [Nocardia sp. alder85J]
MKSVAGQLCSKAFWTAAALVTVVAATGCGGGDTGVTADPDKAQMESTLRTVMSAKNPGDASAQFCAQFADIFKSIPPEMTSNFSTVRPKGTLTKLEAVQITGDKATAQAVGKTDTGGDASGPVTFRKENGTWKYCPDMGFPVPSPAPTK